MSYLWVPHSLNAHSCLNILKRPSRAHLATNMSPSGISAGARIPLTLIQEASSINQTSDIFAWLNIFELKNQRWPSFATARMKHLTAGMTPDQYSLQLGKLLDELAASGIACVLVSPHELLPAAPPIPSPARFNSKIKVYSEATSSVAQSRGLLFVDMFTDFTKRMVEIDAELTKSNSASPSTVYASLAENGMHFTAHGYQCAARIFTERLLGNSDTTRAEAPSHYEARRQLILTKNELYFHRWRPQNITYLFGFRKHEQGNNAADIAKFDPFILDMEKQIHELH